MNLQETKQQIVAIVKKRLKLPHYKVFIFGSRVNGQATEKSDLDVGIDAGEQISAEAILNIQADVTDLPVMQKVEVVDFFNVSDDFKQVALQHVEVIYESAEGNLQYPSR